MTLLVVSLELATKRRYFNMGLTEVLCSALKFEKIKENRQLVMSGLNCNCNWFMSFNQAQD